MEKSIKSSQLYKITNIFSYSNFKLKFRLYFKAKYSCNTYSICCKVTKMMLPVKYLKEFTKVTFRR